MKLFSVLTCFTLLSFSSSFAQKLRHHDNIVYAKSPNWQNIQLNLKLDLVYPGGDKNLPLLMLIHGGGCFGGIKEDQGPVCEMLAMRGFAVANLEYRQGFDMIAFRFSNGHQTGCG